MIGSKADYRRDDFIMPRQSTTPWIPLEKTKPMRPILSIIAWMVILIMGAALALGIANWG